MTIEGSNDPNGVLSLDPDVVETVESEATCKYITLNIRRTGNRLEDFVFSEGCF